jgi:hypothetical protein
MSIPKLMATFRADSGRNPGDCAQNPCQGFRLTVATLSDSTDCKVKSLLPHIKLEIYAPVQFGTPVIFAVVMQ